MYIIFLQQNKTGGGGGEKHLFRQMYHKQNIFNL